MSDPQPTTIPVLIDLHLLYPISIHIFGQNFVAYFDAFSQYKRTGLQGAVALETFSPTVIWRSNVIDKNIKLLRLNKSNK